MNGAEALLGRRARLGVEVCFANPGTTEMPLVAALDRVPGMRAVLGPLRGRLHRRGRRLRAHGRAARALTLLHLGPGFANGLANLHNARRARSAVVNLDRRPRDLAPARRRAARLDIASLARPVSAGCARSERGAASLADDGADAIAAALGPPGRVATLIVPADCAVGRGERAAGAPKPAPTRAASRVPTRSSEPRRALRAPAARLLLRRPRASRARAATPPPGSRADTGARSGLRLFAARHRARRRPPGLRAAPLLPRAGPGRRSPAVEHLVLAGAREPVAFFGYPGQPSRLAPEGCEITTLSRRARRRGRGARSAGRCARRAARALASTDRPAPAPASGALDVGALGRTLAALQPEGAIVVDEAATSGLALRPRTPRGAAAHGARAHGRRDRPGLPVRDRRGPRLPRPARDRVPGRRQRPLHAPGALDAWRARRST